MKSERMRNIIAQGWLSILLILITMAIVSVLQDVLDGNLQGALNARGGHKELWYTTILFIVAAAMPFLIKIFEAKTFKWTVFVITLLWTLSFMVSWVRDRVTAQGHYYHLLFLAHSIVSIWTTIVAYNWARLKNNSIIKE